MEPQEEHNEAEKGKRNMEKLFDLQVFAQENTQTTGGLSAEMKTYYGMELLDNAKPQLVHNQFAATKPLPTGGGKTVEWRKFGSFDKALTPLTEGVTPDGSGISVSYITKELAQYGDYTTVSDMLDLTAIDDVVLEITDRHGANMGLTLDTVTRNEIQQGKQVLYAPAIGADGSKTEVTARGALTAACRLTSEMVAKAATQLKKMNAPTFDGKYVCILHPSVAFDLRQDEAWIAAHQYAAATELFSGEIGELHGVRFVETTEAKIFRGEDLTQNGRTLLVNGKVENNAVVAFDGGTVAAGALAGRYVLLGGERRRVVSNTGSSMTLDSAVTVADNAVIYPGEGGAEGCAVYGCLFVGKGAYGVVDLNLGESRIPCIHVQCSNHRTAERSVRSGRDRRSESDPEVLQDHRAFAEADHIFPDDHRYHLQLQGIRLYQRHDEGWSRKLYLYPGLLHIYLGIPVLQDGLQLRNRSDSVYHAADRNHYPVGT